MLISKKIESVLEAERRANEIVKKAGRDVQTLRLEAAQSSREALSLVRREAEARIQTLRSEADETATAAAARMDDDAAKAVDALTEKAAKVIPGAVEAVLERILSGRP